MAADLLSLTFVDAAGRKGTFSAFIKEDIPITGADFLAMIQTWLNMSNAQLLSAKVSRDIDISGLTNPVASAAGSFDNIKDQAVLQARREDNTGFTKISVPAPADAIFESGGAGNMADVDDAAALVVAFRDAVLDEQVAVTEGEIWRTAQNSQLDWDKGWRKGQAHK